MGAWEEIGEVSLGLFLEVWVWIAIAAGGILIIVGALGIVWYIYCSDRSKNYKVSPDHKPQNPGTIVRGVSHVEVNYEEEEEMPPYPNSPGIGGSVRPYRNTTISATPEVGTGSTLDLPPPAPELLWSVQREREKEERRLRALSKRKPPTVEEEIMMRHDFIPDRTTEPDGLRRHSTIETPQTRTSRISTLTKPIPWRIEPVPPAQSGFRSCDSFVFAQTPASTDSTLYRGEVQRNELTIPRTVTPTRDSVQSELSLALARRRTEPSLSRDSTSDVTTPPPRTSLGRKLGDRPASSSDLAQNDIIPPPIPDRSKSVSVNRRSDPTGGAGIRAASYGARSRDKRSERYLREFDIPDKPRNTLPQIRYSVEENRFSTQISSDGGQLSPKQINEGYVLEQPASQYINQGDVQESVYENRKMLQREAHSSSSFSSSSEDDVSMDSAQARRTMNQLRNYLPSEHLVYQNHSDLGPQSETEFMEPTIYENQEAGLKVKR